MKVKHPTLLVNVKKLCKIFGGCNKKRMFPVRYFVRILKPINPEL